MIMKSMFEDKVFDEKVSIGVNKASLSLAVLSLVVAVALFVVAGKFSGFVYIAVTMVGVALSVVALVKFIGCREYVYRPTRSPMVKQSLYFDITDTTKIRTNLEAGNFAVLNENLSATTSGGARLDTAISKDGKYAVYRLYVYVPYTYEPVTEVTEVAAENVGNFVKIVGNCAK
jgi:hypothetical protein